MCGGAAGAVLQPGPRADLPSGERRDRPPLPRHRHRRPPLQPQQIRRWLPDPANSFANIFKIFS